MGGRMGGSERERESREGVIKEWKNKVFI